MKDIKLFLEDADDSQGCKSRKKLFEFDLKYSGIDSIPDLYDMAASLKAIAGDAVHINGRTLTINIKCDDKNIDKIVDIMQQTQQTMEKNVSGRTKNFVDLFGHYVSELSRFADSASR